MAGVGGETMYGGVTSNPVGSNSGKPEQLVQLEQRIGSSDVSLFAADEDKGKAVLPSAKRLIFKNVGDSAVGVSIKLDHWSSGTAEDSENNKYIHMMVAKGSEVELPVTRMIISDNSAIDAGESVPNTAPDSNMYTDSGADVDTATDGAIASGTTTTTLYLEAGHSKYFRVGDLIRLENEICEITAVGTGADLANSTCTIVRGLYGSTAATHADDVAVRLPFFNAYHDFDKFTTSRTDIDGKFKAFNFFGYGRVTDAPTAGILPGSVAIKCYNPGYQELGLSGITPSTNSGLTAGETYYFKITVDGGTQIEPSITVDSTNTNFGGRNGVLNKIQDYFDTQYYTSGSALFETKVTVAIVNGDIRFTSGSYLSTSAIALAAGTSGSGATVRFFGHATTPTGRIPGSDNIPSAVAARLPADNIVDSSTGESISNTSDFMYDDGNGNIVGNGSGTINYDTGAIDFVSKPNAEFVVSVIHTSALAGKVTETTKNTIQEIKARSMSDKITGKLNLVVEG